MLVQLGWAVTRQQRKCRQTLLRSTCKGNRYLRRILTQSAWSLLRKKDCYLTALFRRVSVKGGRKKAALAGAHRMLMIAWHIIQDGTVYEELGGNHYDRLHPDRSARRLIKRLAQIGFQVTIKKATSESAPMSDPAVVLQKEPVCNHHQPRKSELPIPETASPTRKRRIRLTRHCADVALVGVFPAFTPATPTFCPERHLLATHLQQLRCRFSKENIPRL